MLNHGSQRGSGEAAKVGRGRCLIKFAMPVAPAIENPLIVDENFAELLSVLGKYGGAANAALLADRVLMLAKLFFDRNAGQVGYADLIARLHIAIRFWIFRGAGMTHVPSLRI